MSNNYIYTIQKKHTHTIDNTGGVVYSVDWTLTATNDTGKTATLAGSTAIPYNATTEFILFDELEDVQLIDWIVANTAQDTLDIHYSNLNNQLIYNP